MFKTLLLATDGSPHANRASEKALALAKEISNCTVLILHVSPNAPPRSKLLEAKFDVRAVLEEEAHKAIIKTEFQFKDAGIRYQLDVALGDPASAIVEHAEKHQVGLIIVGSRGLNRFSEVILGSVSHQVTHEAKCPVMIVK